LPTKDSIEEAMPCHLAASATSKREGCFGN